MQRQDSNLLMKSQNPSGISWSSDQNYVPSPATFIIFKGFILSVLSAEACPLRTFYFSIIAIFIGSLASAVERGIYYFPPKTYREMFFKNKNMQQNQLKSMDQGARKICMRFGHS